jgi:hypothetical protein
LATVFYFASRAIQPGAKPLFEDGSNLSSYQKQLLRELSIKETDLTMAHKMVREI